MFFFSLLFFRRYEPTVYKTLSPNYSNYSILNINYYGFSSKNSLDEDVTSLTEDQAVILY